MQEPITPPNSIGEWSLRQIQSAISRQLPPSIVKKRQQGKSSISFISWYDVNLILDKYAPGWNWQITSVQLSADRLFLVGCLTIPTAEGNISRCATGQEKLDCGNFGDPSSNAESMAFRRAAARFGLGLYLYDKD